MESRQALSKKYWPVSPASPTQSLKRRLKVLKTRNN